MSHHNFFWIDDAFGMTQYESFLVYGWNRALPMVSSMLRRGAKIVMTSRDYIYRRARTDLKEGSFPLFREGQVVIDVHDLTHEERNEILYNHLKLGLQSKSCLSKIKTFLPMIAAHPRFVPELARRLANPLLTRGLIISTTALVTFVDRQDAFIQDVIRSLDVESKAALALVYMRNGKLESPITFELPEREAVERLGGTLGGCVDSLESLRGTMVQLVLESGASCWKFKHPTIGDAVAALLSVNAEMIGIYIMGTPIEKLVQQVTCGNVGLEHFPFRLNRRGIPESAWF
jgi:hypothetical protein